MSKKKFEKWMEDSSPGELLDMLLHLQSDVEELWRPGSLGSFMRNRYEIHDDNVLRQRAIKERLQQFGWAFAG